MTTPCISSRTTHVSAQKTTFWLHSIWRHVRWLLQTALDPRYSSCEFHSVEIRTMEVHYHGLFLSLIDLARWAEVKQREWCVDRAHFCRNIGPWTQVQSAVKSIDDMNRMLNRDASTEPIVITYNEGVSVTNLASIAKTQASGMTDFVKGSDRTFPIVRIRMSDRF